MFEVEVSDTSAAGTFSDTLSFSNNDDDENPFTIDLTAQLAGSSIIDDGDMGYADSGNLSGFSQGFKGDIRQASPGTTPRSATWSFEDLPAGVYRVSATWTPFSNRATNAPYTIAGGSPILVNQQLAPSNAASTAAGSVVSDSGAFFADLDSSFSFAGGTLVVGVSNAGANGNVIVDAIRVARVSGPEANVFDDTTGLGVASGSTVDFGDQLTNTAFTRSFSISNPGTETLTLGSPMFSNADFQLMGAFPTSVGAGSSASFVVEVSDTSTPGTFTSMLSFTSNDSDESPYVLHLTADVFAALVIDDGDSPGYTDSANMVRWQQGFQQDVREAVAGGTPQSATYTFTNLPAGMYRVSATWTPFSNRATNAPYTIDGGAPILINQQLAPSNPASTPEGTTVVHAGFSFADLDSSFSFAGGTLTVGVSDTGANGNVIIDAIRVAFLGPLHAEGAAAQPDSEQGSLTTTDVGPVLNAAIDYWNRVDPAAADRLANVQVIVKDLPPSILGLGSFATPTIWLDRDAAGHGWQLRRDVAASGLPSSASGLRMDLLTVITHELGHVLGRPDLDPLRHPNDVMSASLRPGTSRVGGLTPSGDSGSIDGFFAQFELREALGSHLPAGLRNATDRGDLFEYVREHGRGHEPDDADALDASLDTGRLDGPRRLDPTDERFERRHREGDDRVETLDDVIDQLARELA